MSEFKPGSRVCIIKPGYIYTTLHQCDGFSERAPASFRREQLICSQQRAAERQSVFEGEQGVVLCPVLYDETPRLLVALDRQYQGMPLQVIISPTGITPIETEVKKTEDEITQLRTQLADANRRLEALLQHGEHSEEMHRRVRERAEAERNRVVCQSQYDLED